MNGIGPILKRVRTERGITFEEIEGATKIRTKYLQAIEDEKFDLLPGAVYAKGFVNTYVRYLSIGNSPEVVAILQNPLEGKVSPPKEEVILEALPSNVSRSQAIKMKASRPKPPPKQREEQPLTKKKFLIIGLSIAALLLLFGLQKLFSQMIALPDQESKPPVADKNPVVVPEEEITTWPIEPVTPPVGEYEGLVMTLEIVDLNPNTTEKCWIRATTDNKMLFEETLSQGAVKEITATEKISLRLGNGSVVKLTLNGQDLGMAATGTTVVNKDYTLESLNQLP